MFCVDCGKKLKPKDILRCPKCYMLFRVTDFMDDISPKLTYAVIVGLIIAGIVLYKR
jgi:hypothetical protein